MSSANRTRNKSESNAEKLRELLNAHDSTRINRSASKNQLNDDIVLMPTIEDLVRLIQTVENVNQQLLFENKYLKDEGLNMKGNILKLIEENSNLHKELKNVTVLEILTELQNNANKQQSIEDEENKTLLKNQLKNKQEELQQSQILINELQKKLNKTPKNNNSSPVQMAGDTLENMDSFPICCTKCTEELEIKIRQIENLRNDLESMAKSRDFLKKKVEELEERQSDLMSQIKKHYDLVKHLEMEKEQAVIDRDQFKADKVSSEKSLQDILANINEKMLKEKQIIVKNVENELETLNEKNKILEERLFKQENLADRLTRDKITLISEIDSYKKKCNAIDLDTHQMADKLKNKYMDVLKERDILLHDLKRVRHDYDLYMKQNDQDKFCLRNELNSSRNRLMDAERDLVVAKEDCIKLNEQINKLESDVMLLRHSKESVENSRNASMKQIVEQHEKRESKLILGIEEIQSRYCNTVKELEDVIELQRKLLAKLKDECKNLNEQLETLAIKYKTDQDYLRNQNDELNIRLGKYEKRVAEYEEQNDKHNHLHDRMKDRLKEMTAKMEHQNETIKKIESSEALMKTTNTQLMQEISLLKSSSIKPVTSVGFSSNFKGALVGTELNKLLLTNNSSNKKQDRQSSIYLNSVRSAII